MKYVSVIEMAAIERAADAAGHSYASMLEEAGRGLAELVHDRFGPPLDRKVTALVGSGNNGGDALVALAYLKIWGWRASAILLKERQIDDPYLKRIVESGCNLHEYFNPDQRTFDLKTELAEADLLIDGVLGTGFKLPLLPPLEYLFGSIIDVLDELEDPPLIIAVDCPSGVDCDTGEVSPLCLAADLTVTMAAVKTGTLKFPAYDYLGELAIVDIGLPPGLPEFVNITRETVEKEWVISKMPNRPSNAHKGTFGTSLIIAGSEEYPGAAVLAGSSAYRIGSGLVTLAVPQGIYQGLIKSLPEATWLVLKDENGGIAEDLNHQLEGAIQKASACLIGPGLGTRKGTGKFIEKFLQCHDLPALVIDADALRLLAAIKNWHEILPENCVLTPHPGEMSVLTGLAVEKIQKSRVEFAEEHARRWQQTVLLKGAHTIIAAPDGRTKILISANPALARAGSGDVLGGMITGLVSQGVEPFDAAVCGSWIHANAGGIAEDLKGSSAAVLASDISSSIGQVLSILTNKPAR